MLNQATKPSVTFKRKFKAPPQKVYEAWTDPEKLAAWWGPGPNDELMFAKMDVREGGSFAIRFKSPPDEHECRGVYKVVKPGQALEFTWYWHTTPERESYIRINLKPDGDETVMTFIHEQFYDQAACDGHTKGWTVAFEKLDAVLSGDAA